MKTKLAIITLLLISVLLISCTGATQTEQVTSIPTQKATPTATPAPTPERNIPEEECTVTISGSTSIEKMGLATGDEFMAINPLYDCEYRGVGSSLGIENVQNGTFHIAAVSRELTEEEKAYDMEQKLVGYNALAVIVNIRNPVNNLSLDELYDIFTGEITNWSEVGGNDAEIVVVNREDGAPTKKFMYRSLGFEEIPDDEYLEQHLNSEIPYVGSGVCGRIWENENAISYTGLGYLDSSIKRLAIDGYLPTVYNIQSRDYPISTPFYYLYYEENLTIAEKEYLEFMSTDLAKEIKEEKGVIPAECRIGEFYLDQDTDIDLSQINVIFSGKYVGWTLWRFGDSFLEYKPYYRYYYNGDAEQMVLNIRDDIVDIGIQNRALNEEEKEYGLEETMAGYFPFAVVVNENNPVEQLTMEQLRKIFTGKITNWKKVGGADAEILVINDDYSNYRENFYSLLDVSYDDDLTDEQFLKKYDINTVMERRGDDILDALKEDVYAICYLTTEYIERLAKTVSVNGYDFSDENITSGEYPLSYPVYFIYKKKNLNQAGKEFLDYIKSDTAKEVLLQESIVLIGDR